MNKPAPAYYLTTAQFHIIPITDITPEALKKSARKTKTDREKVSLTARQNIIAKSLGFKGGFSGYQQEYKSNLIPFMKEKGLHTRANLITPQHDLPMIKLSAGQIADRIFLSKSPKPKKIFTGYNIDWNVINLKFHSTRNPWWKHFNGQFTLQDFIDAFEGKGPLTDLSPEEVIYSAVEAKRPFITAYWDNLLGDLLVQTEKEEGKKLSRCIEGIFRGFKPNLYAVDIEDPQTEKDKKIVEECVDALTIFVLWSRLQSEGWVEVIPYNEKLNFLKGENGEYDFLFPYLKNYEFDHNIYKPRLRNDDLCKSMDSYHFPRWKYFEYKGWEEHDRHEAESYHYQRGGVRQNPPGLDECLRIYLLDKGSYEQPTAKCSNGGDFSLCNLGGKKLFVSSLITVDQFYQFMDAHPEYCEYSRALPDNSDVDPWQSNNDKIDGHLPAAVTWYDAVAYATWVKKTRELPVRLLSEQEYYQLAAPRKPMSLEEFCQSDASYQNAPQLCQLFFKDLNPNDTDFATINNKDCTQRYIPDALEWSTTDQGVQFLISTYFGEWLAQKSSAINTRTLSGLLDPGASPYRAPFTSDSTGRYKKMKVGFRLCFLAE